MIGSLRWNFAMGATGMLLTFLFSVGHNGLAISGLRALYAFVALFLLGFLFRFIFFVIAGQPPAAREDRLPDDMDGLGGAVNLSTPEDGAELNELLRDQLDGGRKQPDADEFRPLAPKKLISAQNKDAEELAQVIRHITESRDDD